MVYTYVLGSIKKIDEFRLHELLYVMIPVGNVIIHGSRDLTTELLLIFQKINSVQVVVFNCYQEESKINPLSNFASDL